MVWACLVPVQLREAPLAVELESNWDPGALAGRAVQQAGLALVQLLVQLKVLDTPAGHEVLLLGKKFVPTVWQVYSRIYMRL